jgi:hypothetical protein
VVGGCLEAGHVAHRVHQDFAVVWAGAAKQRSVNIKQHKSRSSRHYC